MKDLSIYREDFPILKRKIKNNSFIYTIVIIINNSSMILDFYIEIYHLCYIKSTHLTYFTVLPI